MIYGLWGPSHHATVQKKNNTKNLLHLNEHLTIMKHKTSDDFSHDDDGLCGEIPFFRIPRKQQGTKVMEQSSNTKMNELLRLKRHIKMLKRTIFFKNNFEEL